MGLVGHGEDTLQVIQCVLGLLYYFEWLYGPGEYGVLVGISVSWDNLVLGLVPG